MSKQSYFSVIIPLYNKENYIEDTLRSVINQIFQDFEIIIINDGSTDKSAEKANTIKDDRIQLFSIENHGVSYARNYGIKKASAPLIAFLDADDIWEENHLKHLKSLFDKFPNCGLYATAYAKRTKAITIPSIYRNIPNQSHWMGIVANFFESSLVNCIAWTSAVMIPKKILEEFKGFDEVITLGAGEDTDLWIRIALKYPVAFSNSVTAFHNLHADNRLSNANTNLRKFIDLNKYEDIAIQNKSLKKYLDINRYAIAIQYKLVGNESEANHYIKCINRENLNWKQIILIKSNSTTLKILINIKKRFQKKGIYLSAFR